MSAPLPCSMAPHSGHSASNSSMAIPPGNRFAIISHLQLVLANPNLSPSDLAALVDNLMEIENQKSEHSCIFMIWAHTGDIFRDGKTTQAEPFLRILGEKYHDSYTYAFEVLLKSLTEPSHMLAFLEGLRHNPSPAKGRWHPDYHALVLLNQLLHSKKNSPHCIPALQAFRAQLKQAVEALPPAEYPDAFDFKAADVQEIELLTPKKRMTWPHVMKLYQSNLMLTKYSAVDNSSGACISHQSSDGLTFKTCLLNLVKNLANLDSLLTTENFREFKRLENSPLQFPYHAYERDEAILELLDRSFYAICAALSDADKEIICREMEKVLLETIFQWAFESPSGTIIDDRKEDWFDSWLQHNKFGNILSLDACPINKYGTTKSLKSFSLGLEEKRVRHFLNSLGLFKNPEEQDPEKFEQAVDNETAKARMEKNASRFILEHRRELMEKTVTGLLQTMLAQ